MIVEVTQEDIDGGALGPSVCPVALALWRTVGENPHVHRSYWHIRSCGNGPQENVLLPYHATTFIRRFDRGEPVKPFRFRTRKPGSGL